ILPRKEKTGRNKQLDEQGHSETDSFGLPSLWQKAIGGRQPRELSSFEASSRVRRACPILVLPAPSRPSLDEWSLRGEEKEETSQEMTNLRSGQGEKRQWRKNRLGGSLLRKMTLVVHANTNKKSIGNHDKCDVTIPSNGAADLILIKPQIFGGF